MKQARKIKHTRSRTGCFTCRQRRIKCDEKLPTCTRCEIGKRDCVYPISGRRQVISNIATKESPEPETDSSSTLDFSDGDDKEDRLLGPKPIVKFLDISSSLNEATQTITSEDNESTMQIDQQMLFDSLSSRSEALTSPVFGSPFNLPFPKVSISGLTPSEYCETIRSPFSPAPLNISLQHIPRSPKSNTIQPIRFFLKYHSECVIHSHYFRWYDYDEFHSKGLLGMTEEYEPLRLAVAAFSALLYSMKVNTQAREVAFVFYALALQKFRVSLVQGLHSSEYYPAIAAALQLSTFDRFFGDTPKCFQHLQGAAKILQKHSDPEIQSATVLGRNLLEWYLYMEYYCCMMCAFKPLLSEDWIHADIEVRNTLAKQDYPSLTPEERPARILADVYPEVWALIPLLIRVFNGLSRLKFFPELKKERRRLQLRKELDRFTELLRGFMKSPKVVEISKPSSVAVKYPLKHLECCPPPPFPAQRLAFPAGGYLRLLVLGIQLWVATVIYSPLHSPSIELSTSSSSQSSSTRTPQHPTSSYNTQSAALSLCITYSALDQSFPQDYLFPCFAPLVMAGLTCPLEIRMWLWHKLAHFEELGYFSFEPVRRQLAFQWGMPQLLTSGFKGWKERVPGGGVKTLGDDDIDIMIKMANVGLELEDT